MAQTRAHQGGVELFAALDDVPAIGILRGCPLRWAFAVGDAAAEAGFRVLEVTLDSPDPYRSIEHLSGLRPGVVVGAGSVRSGEQVRRAIAAGARFLVSPVMSRPLIDDAEEYGVLLLPGAATPTEIWTAHEAGAQAVKVFPAAQLGGPDYISALLAPLGGPRLVPTGGVSTENARTYLEAGALAVAVGGTVFRREAMESGDIGLIGRRARAFVEAVV